MGIMTVISLVFVIVAMILAIVFTAQWVLKQNKAHLALQNQHFAQVKEYLDKESQQGQATANKVVEMFTRMEEFKKNQESTVTEQKTSMVTLAGEIQKHLKSTTDTLTDTNKQSLQAITQQVTTALEKLGEFKELSKGVDGLSKVLSNVKQKGNFGEYQLEQIICDLVPTAYYRKQYSLRGEDSSAARVDFVIRMPGQHNEWLPIDSKYPHEPYVKLLAAREHHDSEGEKKAKKELVSFLRTCADAIKKKYILPPQTTDFAILFIPQESIFFECYQDSNLLAELRTKYKVVLTGPNHFHVLLHMIVMGYHKLNIEQRSQEIAKALAAFKDSMEGVVEGLDKIEIKAGGLHKDIHRIHGRAGRIKQEISTVERLEPPTPPPAALAETPSSATHAPTPTPIAPLPSTTPLFPTIDTPAARLAKSRTD